MINMYQNIVLIIINVSIYCVLELNYIYYIDKIFTGTFVLNIPIDGGWFIEK